MQVSVVVPVWNPGPNLTRCVESLLAQTCRDYEIVFVDDGSSDGTAERLDELAVAHPAVVRVIHIANSGWPGRPRNVGIAAARGEYVHLIDNDDVLPPYALAALYERGVATDADIVFGRPASDFRGLNHRLYRHDISGATLADHPDIAESGTPHKMLRRRFLLEHDLRFPEGPVPLEDLLFMTRAFALARSISVLTDRPYYFYLRRLGSGRNAGDRTLDPLRQCAAVEQVIDVIDTHVTDPQLREVILRRILRVNLLARLTERSLLADAEHARRMVAEVRRVIRSRFAVEVDAGCGAATRTHARLLRAGVLADLVAFAGRHAALRAAAVITDVEGDGGALRLRIDGGLYMDDTVLRCERAGDGWALPASLAPSAPVSARVLDPRRDEVDVELAAVSRMGAESFETTDGLSLAVDPAGDVRITGSVLVDPELFARGAPLADGLWDLRLRLRFAGWSRVCALRFQAWPRCGESVGVPRRSEAKTAAGTAAGAGTAAITAAGRGVRLFAGAAGPMILDVGQWAGTVAAQVASDCRLAVVGSASLRLDVPLATTGRPVTVELLGQPEPGTAGDRFVLTGQLIDNAAVLDVPCRLPTGRWRAWLRLADPGAAPAEALPWTLRSRLGRLSVERRADPAPPAAARRAG